MFRIVWKQDPGDIEIGYYTVHLEEEDGSIVEGSAVALWDYTVPWQVEHHESRDINRRETFMWLYVYGSITCRTYTEEDNMTLETVKREIEKFICDMYIVRYEDAVECVEKYRELAEWCKKHNSEVSR